MLARALIVLLVVLNLGVAAWWIARPDLVAEAPFVQPDGVPRLRLLSELPAGQRPVAVAPAASTSPAMADAGAAAPGAVQSAAGDAATAAATPAPADAAPVPPADADAKAAPVACFAIGPFADAATASAARARLQPQVLRLRERQAAATSARGWRVWLPPLADRAAAQAMAARITAAGFGDLFILSTGSDDNGIALGRFGSEPSARQHEAALRAAGFADVRAESLGGDPPRTWLDVAAAAPSTAAQLRALTSADRANAIDCATVP